MVGNRRERARQRGKLERGRRGSCWTMGTVCGGDCALDVAAAWDEVSCQTSSILLYITMDARGACSPGKGDGWRRKQGHAIARRPVQKRGCGWMRKGRRREEGNVGYEESRGVD